MARRAAAGMYRWLMAAALGAAAAVLADASLLGLRGVFVVAKPLTTLLLIGYAVQRGAPRAIVLGLLLSLAGDVALMWDGAFVIGLAAFLCAHLAYLWAFAQAPGRTPLRAAAPLAYGTLALGLLALLWPRLPAGLHAPVAIYAAVLAAMAASASRAGRLAALGGGLFVLSDACLAIHRFHTPLPASALWVLPPYWLAQTLIAAALRRPSALRAAATSPPPA